MHTHSQRLERWLGADQVAVISASMRHWHGKPIRIAGVPGHVYAARGGDFVGAIRGGHFMSLAEYAAGRLAHAVRAAARSRGTLHAGFTSLSDLVSEATSGGKKQFHTFNKVGTASAAAPEPMSLWNVGAKPAAGGVGGTSGTGRATTRATTGALGQDNPALSGDQLHLVSGHAAASVPNTLLAYDRLWDMTYNHASSVSTAIDALNRPTRYQTSALAPSSFVSGEVTTALSVTAHNITVTYVDDAGNTAEAAAAYAAPVSAAANRIPLVSPNWFLPLNSGDRGARYLTNIAQSTIAAVTGVSNFFVGHPLAFLPCPVANLLFDFDWVYSTFNLERIFDNACVSFLEMPKTATTATTYNGALAMVAG